MFTDSDGRCPQTRMDDVHLLGWTMTRKLDEAARFEARCGRRAAAERPTALSL